MLVHGVHTDRTTHAERCGKTEWSSVVDLIPSGLDLFSARASTRQGLELALNATNRRRFVSVLAKTQADLREAKVPILVNDHRDERRLIATSDLTRSQRRWLGQVALELYFIQLLRSDIAILDLWPSRLGVTATGDAVWYPRPFYLAWDRDFLEAVRNVYTGFFLGKGSRFQEGVNQLRLGSSAKLLLQHLGGDNQRGVRFNTRTLQSTFLDICNGRSSADGSLHRNFIAFGLYVASLHELLENLDLGFDVRGAFMRSYRGQ